jgi:hypothetical protein
MSDNKISNFTSPSVSRLTENITDVVYISLPIPLSTTFSCYICNIVGQKLATHNSLKKTYLIYPPLSSNLSATSASLSCPV